MSELILIFQTALLLRCYHSSPFLIFFSFNLLFSVSVGSVTTGPTYFALSTMMFFAIAAIVKPYENADKIIECCLIASLINVLGVVLWYAYFSPTTYQVLFACLYVYMFFTIKKVKQDDLSDNRSKCVNKSLLDRSFRSFKDTFRI